jgi:hypothetical protein
MASCVCGGGGSTPPVNLRFPRLLTNRARANSVGEAPAGKSRDGNRNVPTTLTGGGLFFLLLTRKENVCHEEARLAPPPPALSPNFQISGRTQTRLDWAGVQTRRPNRRLILKRVVRM